MDAANRRIRLVLLDLPEKMSARAYLSRWSLCRQRAILIGWSERIIEAGRVSIDFPGRRVPAGVPELSREHRHPAFNESLRPWPPKNSVNRDDPTREQDGRHTRDRAFPGRTQQRYHRIISVRTSVFSLRTTKYRHSSIDISAVSTSTQLNARFFAHATSPNNC
jgi:hypothetical protein